MKIIQIQPKNRRQQKAFINFPFDLYKNNPYWVPPFRMDMRKIFKPENAFYQYGEAAFFLALDENERVSGRLAVANNSRYNQFHGTKTGFFYYFECIDDHRVARALFENGFKWAKTKGLTHMLGPKGFTVLDGFGLLIEGFDQQPAFGQAYNLPYYPELIEAQGFSKVKDILTGWVDRQTKFPEKIQKAARIIKKRRGVHIPVFKHKSELQAVAADLQMLYNESLAESAGNPPVTNEEMEQMVSQLLWIADPKLIKVMYRGKRPIGWLLAYPDVGSALQRARGNLFPLGWLYVLLESKRSQWIDFNGVGIIEEYQRLGVTSIFFSELYETIMESDRYRYGELLQFREENINSLLEVSNLDIHFHKKHRLYEKEI
ncbi:MAG: hypothetical protein ACOX7C_01290 [Brevefilum sp.]|jgi:hypothetical protein